MRNQSANYPSLCSNRIPEYNFTLIRQHNNNGRSHYFLNLELQSDPAALQALEFVDIAIERHGETFVDANQFVS